MGSRWQGKYLAQLFAELAQSLVVATQLVGSRAIKLAAELPKGGQPPVDQQFDHQQVLVDGGAQDRAQTVMGTQLPVHVVAQTLELVTQRVGLKVEGKALVVGTIDRGQHCSARGQKLLLEAGWPLDGVEDADRLLQRDQSI